MQKHVLITVLLIIHCLVIGKSQKLDTFSVTFKTAFKDSIKYTDWKEFRDTFYILKNGVKLPFDTYKKSKNGNKIKISGLTKGNYIVRYENIFNQIIDSSITIKRKKIRNTRIYLDEFIDTVKMSFFEELKDSDSLKIHYSIRDCHSNGSNELIEIVKKEGKFNATFFKFIDLFPADSINKKTGKKISYYEDGKPIKTFIKSKTMSVNDIGLIYHVFKRLRTVHNTGGLSGVHLSYSITLNNKLLISIYDDNFDIGTFDLLKEKIFGIKWNYDYYKK